MVCLPNKHEDDNLNGAPGTITGWGLTSISPPLMSSVLRSTTLKILSPDMCDKLMLEQGVIIDDSIQICAHQPNKQTGTCSGDSGGKNCSKKYMKGVGWLGFIFPPGFLLTDKIGMVLVFTYVNNVFVLIKLDR